MGLFDKVKQFANSNNNNNDSGNNNQGDYVTK
nr:DDRP 48, DNA damage-responsive protein 48=DDR 48 product {N-terminal} [Saccharomyces cerevisiae, Peptide Partial, 31 aa] [Saccharomyces cerevisiae]